MKTVKKTLNDALHEVYGEDDDWFVQDDWWEDELRTKHKSLQNAWEQYQIMLKLTNEQ